MPGAHLLIQPSGKCLDFAAVLGLRWRGSSVLCNLLFLAYNNRLMYASKLNYIFLLFFKLKIAVARDSNEPNRVVLAIVANVIVLLHYMITEQFLL